MIRVADWSTTPGARYRHDGPFSGQEYRDDVLLPAITKALRERDRALVVDLDGVQGYAAGWLEEVFGGLARELGRHFVEVFVVPHCSDEPGLVTEIEAYVGAAP